MRRRFVPPRVSPIGTIDALLANSRPDFDPAKPRLLAPCDLQAIKAAGVTFVESMLERVIEEQARGDASKADAIRERIAGILGGSLSSIRPGSEDAARIKQVLVEQGAWSQYLEVGIGPDAEIFTKTQPMASVGHGALIGLHPKSAWNNPEPEIVLAVNSRGRIQGATLGNDVNLRDFEGRSALLLSKAKDNNASCSIGPFIRLFDAGFTLDDVRACELALDVYGEDGFHLAGRSSMKKISRDPRGSRRAGTEREPSVSGWLRAVPGHDVRAGQGPRRAGRRLHASSGRPRRHRHRSARRARERRHHQRQGAAVDFRRRRTVAQSCAARGLLHART